MPSGQKERWERRFDELRDFKERHGHTLVPRSWAENKQLATWVRTQREERRKFDAECSRALETIATQRDALQAERADAAAERDAEAARHELRDAEVARARASAAEEEEADPQLDRALEVLKSWTYFERLHEQRGGPLQAAAPDVGESVTR